MTNDEKRAIIEAATHGPWEVKEWTTWDNDIGGYVEIDDNDREFIAAARTEWPKDLERLETLERENAELRQRLKKMVKVNFEYYRQIKSLKELLKDLQWDDDGCCQYCATHIENGHTGDCRIAALLREGDDNA